MKVTKFILGLCLLFWQCCVYAQQSRSNSVLFVSGRHSNMAKLDLLKENVSTTALSIKHVKAEDLDDTSEALIEFNKHALVVFSGVSKRDTLKSFEPLKTWVKKSSSRFLSLRAIELKALRKDVTTRQAETVAAYYANGGAENMNRLGQYLLALLAEREANIEPPIIYPGMGIYHPDYKNKIFPTRQDYLEWRKLDLTVKKPTMIGVLMQRASIESENTELADSLIHKIEANGMVALPFYFELSPRTGDLSSLLKIEGKTVVDVIANLRSIHWASARRADFEKLAVPVVQALVYFDGDQKQWEASTQGISPGMSPFQLVLPEAAGVIDPTIIAATNSVSKKIEVIDYQLDFYVGKLMNIAKLNTKDNAQKRLAVMVWGDRDVGASFLNIPDSLRSMSQRLSQEGYGIKSVSSDYFSDKIDRILSPFYRAYELESLLEDDLAELMPVSEYLSWFNRLPEQVRKPINDYWGEAKDNFMVVDYQDQRQFVLPRIRNGNMLIMRQPPRADNDEEDKRIFHKGTIPMNHYYLAAYYYVRAYWASDAIVHLGTHGSHEYLPGKERGLSRYDQGNLATADTPVVYPFIVDDVGEAMQTKRRGSATVLGHMTPPFAAAGLQDELADLHELMHQYKSMDEGGVKQKTADQIIEACEDKKICDDIGWQREKINADFSSFLEELHSYMEQLASENQPLGLHSFGLLPEPDYIVSTLLQMLGRDFSQHAAEFEAEYYQAASVHHVHDEHEHGLHAEAGHLAFAGSGEGLDAISGFRTLRDFVVLADADVSMLPDELRSDIEKAKAYYQQFEGIKELDHLVDFLSANYIPVKTGGDPIRHPESLATGFNLYGFDPSRVPTKAAYEQGVELTEQLMADYYVKHGRYPNKLAFSLWSMETMRHYGVLEAQVLHAMGVKPVWSPDGRVVGTEILPASELKRPRVDVVLSATGLYRDAFPNVMQWMAKAIAEVAQLKEANNSIWDNSQRVQAQLITEGISEDEALYLSSVRIFSNESGNYGSGLGDAVVASDQWEQDSKLADLYLSRMGWYYGADNDRWGQKSAAGVDLYAKTLSGTDVALFSRSSNVYGMLASDDPFQYFGGLALAIRNIDGTSPEMYISNLRDAKRPKSENAARFLAKELRTRSQHPRWIKAMKEEGYSGSVSLASTMSNLFGWQVVSPNLVRDDQWQEMFEVYVEDKHELALNEWFEQVNPKAQATILERMLEASRKEYWQADDKTLTTMIERLQELANKHQLQIDNQKLRDYMQDQASGFGLEFNLPAVEAAGTPLDLDSSASQQIQGQKLEPLKSDSHKQDKDWTLFFILFACLAIVLSGACSQVGGTIRMQRD